MENIERSLPYICYAMAVTKASLFLATGNEIEVLRYVEKYYNDYIHTNMFVSITLHPFYMCLMALLRPHYKTFDYVMKEMKKSSENNSLSLRIMMNTFNCLTTWVLVYTAITLMLSSRITPVELLLRAFASGLAIAAGGSVAINLFGRLSLISPHFKWYSFGVHAMCMLAGAGAYYSRSSLRDLPPIVVSTILVMGAHGLGYMFMRLATFDLPSRDERGLSLLIHAIFVFSSMFFILNKS